MKNWENFTENHKIFICICTILLGGALGGIFLPILLTKNVIIGMGIGAMTATLLLATIIPGFEKRSREDLQGKRTKRKPRSDFKDLQIFLHPTRRHILIGSFWFFLIVFFLVPLSGKGNENLRTINVAGILLLLFISLDGYQMVKRNVRINRYGSLVYGAGSQYIGYLIMFVCWGGLFIGILTIIFDL